MNIITKNRKKIIVFGLGSSGKAVLKYLVKIYSDIIVWDDNFSIREEIKLNYPKVNVKDLKLINWDEIFMAIVSPGIKLNHPLLSNAYKKNVPIYRDLEIFIQNVDSSKVIAVTGTNGKSTTVSIIKNLILLKESNCFFGGNIDPPLLEALQYKPFNKYIIELSSYQLESSPSFNSYISILLNIFEDHLDRYNNIENYISAKKNIFNNLNPNQYAIIGIDDPICNSIYNEMKLNSKIVPISLKNNLDKGIFIKNNIIIDNYFKFESIDLKDTILNKTINYQNIAAVYAVSKILDFPNELFLKTIKEFKGLKHRAQIVYNDKNLIIVNDSKATNLSSAIESIKLYDNIHLIMGGKIKNKNYDDLISISNRIKKIYLIGESSDYIEEKLNKKIKCEKYLIMEKAFNKCIVDINKYVEKSTILLSPACSSLDQYKNFEARGDEFINLAEKFNYK